MRVPTLDTTEYALLGLLCEAPCHGYALAQALAPTTQLGRMVRLRSSQLYFFLHKFEDAAWIAAIDATATERHRVFSMTAAGHAVFDAWRETPVTRPRDMRLGFVLKLYFTQRLAPDRVDALIAKQQEALQHYLDQLTDLTIIDDPDQQFFATIVVPLRMQQTQATLAWLSTLPALLTPIEAKGYSSNSQ